MARRQARETAMQVLFEVDLGKAEAKGVFERTIGNGDLNDRDASFSKQLVFGVIENLPTLDGIIARLSQEWDVKRLAPVDKNLLRISLYEMLYLPDIPNNVSINEAIELAKVYSGDDSPKFINGILGKVVKDPSLYVTAEKDANNEPANSDTTQ